MQTEVGPTKPFCAPHTAAHFHVERQLPANGIFADIRHFGWTDGSRAVFEPDAYYLDFSIGPRCPSSRFFQSDKQLARISCSKVSR